ncbi:MAG: hypothetical protein LC808_32035 [Actinobacteria bacterium]|nr:hypothetical protein [Actinomycetota bacterium]
MSFDPIAQAGEEHRAECDVARAFPDEVGDPPGVRSHETGVGAMSQGLESRTY